MNRTGSMSVEYVVKLILIMIVGGMMLGMLVIKILPETREQTREALCYQSIVTAHKGKYPDLECDVKYLTLERDDFPSDQRLADRESSLDDEVKREIAKEMYSCWSMVGAGELHPYTLSPVKTTGEEYAIHYCVLCAVISFEDIPQWDGLYSWLATNVPSKGKPSYYATLYGIPDGLAPGEFKEIYEARDLAAGTYDTSERYAVVWCEELKRKLAEKLQYSDTIEFVPYASLTDTCDFVMN